MRNLWKGVLGIWVISMGLGLSAPAQAASGVGPYYATPSWDQTFPAATRFIVLTNMNSEAVLDRETGLVWEQSPSTSTLDWFAASEHCINLNAGGRTGWRLPAIQELMSLVDRSVPVPPVSSEPRLPSGHPFNTGGSFYWSATTRAIDPASARDVFLNVGAVGSFDKSLSAHAWCVRGGQGVDPQ